MVGTGSPTNFPFLSPALTEGGIRVFSDLFALLALPDEVGLLVDNGGLVLLFLSDALVPPVGSGGVSGCS